MSQGLGMLMQVQARLQASQEEAAAAEALAVDLTTQLAAAEAQLEYLGSVHAHLQRRAGLPERPMRELREQCQAAQLAMERLSLQREAALRRQLVAQEQAAEQLESLQRLIAQLHAARSLAAMQEKESLLAAGELQEPET